MHKFLQIDYELHTIGTDGTDTLVEHTTKGQPFQFITGLGMSLDTFEEKVADLETGSKFQFTLTPDEAHGSYDPQKLIDLPRGTFTVNGHFDAERIRPNAIIPLMDADGHRFQAIVRSVDAENVRVDLNHPLAGKTIRFTGTIIEARPATDKEIEGMLNLMSGEGCHCGCDGECGDDCQCDHEHGHGHGHHHHDDGSCGGRHSRH